MKFTIKNLMILIGFFGLNFSSLAFGIRLGAEVSEVVMVWVFVNIFGLPTFLYFFADSFFDRFSRTSLRFLRVAAIVSYISAVIGNVYWVHGLLEDPIPGNFGILKMFIYGFLVIGFIFINYNYFFAFGISWKLFRLIECPECKKDSLKYITNINSFNNLLTPYNRTICYNCKVEFWNYYKCLNKMDSRNSF